MLNFIYNNYKTRREFWTRVFRWTNIVVLPKSKGRNPNSIVTTRQSSPTPQSTALVTSTAQHHNALFLLIIFPNSSHSSTALVFPHHSSFTFLLLLLTHLHLLLMPTIFPLVSSISSPSSDSKKFLLIWRPW